jgi:antagonist of KipI
MADGQPTGGYPCAGVVITADLPLAAQLLPGDAVRFRDAGLAEARRAYREQRAMLDAALPPVSEK